MFAHVSRALFSSLAILFSPHIKQHSRRHSWRQPFFVGNMYISWNITFFSQSTLARQPLKGIVFSTIFRHSRAARFWRQLFRFGISTFSSICPAYIVWSTPVNNAWNCHAKGCFGEPPSGRHKLLRGPKVERQWDARGVEAGTENEPKVSPKTGPTFWPQFA